MSDREPALELSDERPQASRALAVTAAGAAVFAGVVIPGNQAGLGITLVAFTVAGVIAAGRPATVDALTLTYTALALALAVVPSLRAAAWVAGPALAGSIGVGSFAVVRAAGWREIVSAPFVVAARVVPAVRFLGRPMLPDPGRVGRLAPVVRGAALGGVLLLVFGSLFASADRAFAEIAGELLIPNIDLSLVPARIAVFGVILLGTGAFILAGRRQAGIAGPGIPGAGARRLAPAEWMTALGILDLLFLAFVLVQVAVLFGGRAHVLDTTGLTYAEYARQGFFQLVAVGGLTFAVIAGTVRWARRDSERRTLVLRVLLGALILLALVVLASALRRLTLYESTFGYTRLRISVHATILWMAALFVILLVAGTRMRAGWLPAGVVTASALALLVFGLADPERIVAEHNVERFEATGLLDLEYARTLGADAVPTLAQLPAGLRCWALMPVAARLGADRADALVEWNLARSRARQVLLASAPRGCDIDDLTALPGVRWRTL